MKAIKAYFMRDVTMPMWLYWIMCVLISLTAQIVRALLSS
jgi:hypothetical protein